MLMKSTKLDHDSAATVVQCLKVAAGEIEHSLEVLDGKLSEEDYETYRKTVGKVIVAIYTGLADPILEGFPALREQLYREENS